MKIDLEVQVLLYTFEDHLPPNQYLKLIKHNRTVECQEVMAIWSYVKDSNIFRL